VAQSDKNAPFVPRGAVIKDGVIYVANFVLDNSGTPGRVEAFAGSGALLGQLTPADASRASRFRPRGVVIGPDGLLYVSSDPNFVLPMGPTTGGEVLKFDPNTLDFKGTLISDLVGGSGQLNRPEALVFGPDGRLYVTSFRADPFNSADTDSIRIYDVTGLLVDVINLDKGQQKRVAAQALLFGPDERLYVPINDTLNADPNHVGEVRSYDVATHDSTVVLPPFAQGGTLKNPWFLTFGRTNSATLAYGD
jgi:glucose/arabinose dehydrogenase